MYGLADELMRNGKIDDKIQCYSCGQEIENPKDCDLCNEKFCSNCVGTYSLGIDRIQASFCFFVWY